MTVKKTRTVNVQQYFKMIDINYRGNVISLGEGFLLRSLNVEPRCHKQEWVNVKDQPVVHWLT